MTTDPKVSILVPLYNQQRYIKACLQSISRQTYNNLEIIIINDGSIDQSASIASQWAARDQRVVLIDKCNEGVNKARRDGLLKATGDYVAFVDSDDLLPERAIEILVCCMEQNGVDLVLGSMSKKLGFIKRDHTDKDMSFPCHQVIAQPELFDKYYIGFFLNSVFTVSMWGRLYRKEAIDKAMRETELFEQDVDKMGEDQFFNLKLFPYLRSMYRTDETVYIYRMGGGTSRFNPNFPQLFASSDKRLKLLDQHQYQSGYKPLFDEYVACLYFYASQLIYDKRADKAGVIDLFKREMSEREVARRMMEYFTQNPTVRVSQQLMLKHDYEGMYQYAAEQGNRLFGSWTAKTKSLLLRLIERFC